MEQEAKQMTVVEALRITEDLLNGIELPVSLLEKVGTKIAGAVGTIEQCIIALEGAAKKEAQQSEDEPEISIEPVTEEEMGELHNGNHYAE